MSDDGITITYGIEDGYAGGARPHHVHIDFGDLEDCETEGELENRIDAAVEDHMRETVSCYWNRDQLAGLLDRIAAQRDEA